MTRRPLLRTVARWTARLAASVVVLVLVAATTIYGLSTRDLRETFTVPEHPLTVPADSASIAKGARIATIKGCTDCHGDALRGNVLIEDPAFGRLAAPNLTKGGRGEALTTEDWERAVRHGVRRDGSPLFVMPSAEFTTISDEDLGAMIAYARSLPATSYDAGPSKAGPVLRTLQVLGKLDVRSAAEVDHGATHLASITPEPTVTYGKYMAIGCTGCHGKGFSGGRAPGAPPDFLPAANITPKGIGHYTEADFIRVLRTGVRPDGSNVNPQMPWKMTKHMTDTEIIAMYKYLQTVPPKEYGLR